MTEQEWNTTADVAAMLEWIMPDGRLSGRSYIGVGDRKLQCFVDAAKCAECDQCFGDDTWAWRANFVATADCDNRPRKASLLRCVIGNPFRPIIVNEGQYALTTTCGIVLDRRWLTSTVKALATAAYSERGRVCVECAGRGTVFVCDPNDAFAAGAVKCSACHGTGRIEDGTLDNDRLAVLADALEDAGCVDEAILAHLRSDGPHVRGCWVIDLILGKS